ncbi:MAG: hypothetical protein LCH43_06325 [Actinobacteria bacterium]|nr:hypothetical protein [Actinomycetota bacterium]
MGFMDMFRPVNAPIAGGVEGTAQVVSASVATGTGVFQKCSLHLVINAPGLTPTAVEFTGAINVAKWPTVGGILPVSVDPNDPRHYAILWNQVPRRNDVAKTSAEGVAAALRGEPDALAKLVSGGMLGDTVQIIGDPSHITPEAKAKLAAFGIDIDALIAGAAQAGGGATPFTVVPGLGSVSGSASGSVSGSVSGSASGSDDVVSKLERLQALRTNGTLTDAEFESGKKMILGG